jgi:putative DNA primase/helicase
VTVESFIGHLDLVRRSGSGWVARCPAHDDCSPSLCIRVGSDGRTLIKCHAGCASTDIVSALGLQMSDLFGQSRLRPVMRRRRLR